MHRNGPLPQVGMPKLKIQHLHIICFFGKKIWTWLRKTSLCLSGLKYLSTLNLSNLRTVQFLQKASKNIKNNQDLTELLKIYYIFRKYFDKHKNMSNLHKLKKNQMVNKFFYII